METIQTLYGNPKIIVSDKDSIFTGNFWIKLFSCQQAVEIGVGQCKLFRKRVDHTFVGIVHVRTCFVFSLRFRINAIDSQGFE